MMKQDWTECFHHSRRVLIKSPLLGQFVCVESLVTAVVDMYPETFRRGYRRELLILGMSVVSFLIGLIMCTEVGLTLTFTSSSSLPSLCHRYDSSIVSEVIGWLTLWSLWPSWDVWPFEIICSRKCRKIWFRHKVLAENVDCAVVLQPIFHSLSTDGVHSYSCLSVVYKMCHFLLLVEKYHD